MLTIIPETIKNNCIGSPVINNIPLVSNAYPVIYEPIEITVIPTPIANSANPAMSKSNFNLGSLGSQRPIVQLESRRDI
jgi:hypothetical protein